MMMRKIAIGLAAAIIATGGLTLSASAHRGGGMGHVSSYSKGGLGKGGPSRMGMYRPVHSGPRQYGYYHGYRPGPHFDHWRPHYWGPRYGGYYYGGSCWRNVWTPGGWTRQWVCGYRPYGYAGSSSRTWHGPRHGERGEWGHRRRY
jgi:hypothetical protein